MIICPKCSHQFEPTDAMRDEIRKEANLRAAQWKKEKEEEFRRKELSLEQAIKNQQETAEKQRHEHQQQLEKEKKLMAEQLEANLRKQLMHDFAMKMELLEKSNAENEQRLRIARQKELEYLQQQQRLIDKENQIDLEIQRKLLEARITLEEQIRKQELDKSHLKETEYQLQLKELQKQIDDQKKLAEEMRRKAEQGSMQLQGEAQELVLEDILRTSFPFDAILEVGKGIKGADCIQVIRNQFGQQCGRIIYESKRTQNFSPDWIEKLKSDMRSQGADIAILVTQRMPKDLERFGEKDGIYICNFTDVKALASVLRDGILKLLVH